MRRVSWTVGLVVVLVMGAAVPAVAAGERALWVWDAPSQEIIDFAAAEGITDIYLHAGPGFSTDPAYAQFVADAHAAGLNVHAMAGDPAWAKQSADWTSWVDEVVAHGGFDGVVFDVEPYLHPDWGTKKQNRLIRSFLSGLDSASGAAGSLPVIAAVPFWFDEIKVKRNTLVEEVLGSTDGIVVMAYRDQANGSDGIVAHSAFEADLAASMGRTFIIGVETGPASLDKVTFAEEGRTYMEEQLAIVTAAFSGTSGYGGLAIHHYGSYSQLAP